jgi:uncharacterized LabA/DUF88 family protein
MMPKSRPRVSLYVDGFNLYKGLLIDHPEFKWLDLNKLAKLLSPEKEVVDVYYFTAEIKPQRPDDLAPFRQKLYLRTLEVSGVKVIKGKFRADPRWMPVRDRTLSEFTRPDIFRRRAKAHGLRRLSRTKDAFDVLVTKYEEKQSDVNLASHLLRDVYEGRVTHAMVISGDTDLTTAIRFSVEAGCHVSIYIPARNNASAALTEVASYLGWLKLSSLEASQLPPTVISPKGKPLIRPSDWA